MKTSILIITLVFLIVNSFAQSPETFTHQLIVRDNSNNVIANQTMGIRLTLAQGSLMENVVYRETFSSTSNSNGLISIKVGAGSVVNGNFSAINWGKNGPDSMEIAIDTANGSDYTLFYTEQLKSVPYALHSKVAGFSNEVNYASLSNKPFTITSEQRDKVNLLEINSEQNLDLLKEDISVNNDKSSFPGFGTTLGTAYDIVWTEIDDSVYYNTGNVGLGVSMNSDFGGSVLHVGGGILYDSIDAKDTPGLLFYDNSSLGQFSYYNELGELNTIGRNINYISSGFSGIYSTGTLSGLRTLSDYDVIINSNLSIGSGATPFNHLDENTMTFSDSILRIKFYDTSSSASFPTTDWQLVFNDLEDEGDNYFGLKDLDQDNIPFKLMAGATDNSLFIAENGDIALGTSAPTAKLETAGKVIANSYVGNGSQLTGLSIVATDTTENTGSTTLAADTDADNDGAILFQTQNTNRMVFTNSGRIGIGNDVPETHFDVKGTTTFTNNLIVNDVFRIPIKKHTDILNDQVNSSFSLYDVSDKNIIYLDGSIKIFGIQGGFVGQEITIINTGATNTIEIQPGDFISNGNKTDLIQLPQYGTITMVCTSYSTAIVTDLVTTL